MIVRCDAVKNYMFLRDSQLVYGGWIVMEVAMNYMLLQYLLQVLD